MACNERFSLPRNDKALAATLQDIVEDLKYDIPRLERRVVNIRAFMERIIGEGWSMGYNPKRINRGREETEHSGYSVQAPRCQRLFQNWMDDVEDEDEDDVVVSRKRKGWNGVPTGVDLSSYTYRDDTNANDMSPFSNSSGDTTDSSSESREPLMSGANGTSPSSSHSPASQSRIANDVHDEGDTASLHRKKDSGNAEFMSGTRADTGEGEGAIGRSKLRRSFSNVMNRGRPNKGRREARKVSGLPTR